MTDEEQPEAPNPRQPIRVHNFGKVTKSPAVLAAARIQESMAPIIARQQKIRDALAPQMDAQRRTNAAAIFPQIAVPKVNRIELMPPDRTYERQAAEATMVTAEAVTALAKLAQDGAVLEEKMLTWTKAGVLFAALAFVISLISFIAFLA